MSGICGWVGRESDSKIHDDIVSRMVEPLTRFDGATAASVASARACMAVATRRPIDRSVFQQGNQAVVVWGAMRFLEPEAKASASRDGAAAAFARHCLDLGPRGLERVAGAFAVAAADAATGTTLLAVDRAGVRPLLYSPIPDGVAFGSTADALIRHPEVGAQIDPQAIYDYLYFHMIPGPSTIYAAVRRLGPGEYLLLQGTRIEVGQYWKMSYEENRPQPFEELKKAFVASIRDGVAEVLDGSGTGCFLSGGTDSSTVAGLVGELSGRPAETYSIGFEAEGYDEMSYARIASRHFGTHHHEYYVTPDDVADTIPHLAQVFDQPFGNSSAIPTYYCARMARQDGVELLLGGDGGDELFGGNVRYARQHVYSLYHNIPSALRRAVVEPIAFGVPLGERISLLRRARGYIRQARIPMPERMESWNLLERFGNASVLTPEFLGAVDTGRPMAQLKQVYAGARAKAQVNRMLAVDLKFTLADNDLPKVERPCELAGVDVAFPLLDDRVIQFSASLQPRLKLKGTRLRYFFKESLRDFLPPEIITKEKHGFGLPFGPWYREHRRLRDLVDGTLSDLRRRNIVRSTFLDQLHGHVADHAGYYGTMVWILMMLELWLQARRIELD